MSCTMLACVAKALSSRRLLSCSAARSRPETGPSAVSIFSTTSPLSEAAPQGQDEYDSTMPTGPNTRMRAYTMSLVTSVLRV